MEQQSLEERKQKITVSDLNEKLCLLVADYRSTDR